MPASIKFSVVVKVMCERIFSHTICTIWNLRYTNSGAHRRALVSAKQHHQVHLSNCFRKCANSKCVPHEHQHFSTKLPFQNIFQSIFSWLLSTPLDLNATRVRSLLVAQDNHLVHKKAPLDSMAIYSKPGQALLYTTLDQWNEMSYKYTFTLQIPFYLHVGDATTSI